MSWATRRTGRNVDQSQIEANALDRLPDAVPSASYDEEEEEPTATEAEEDDDDEEEDEVGEQDTEDVVEFLGRSRYHFAPASDKLGKR